MASQVHDLIIQARSMFRTSGLSSRDVLLAGAFIVGVWFLNYLRKLLALRRVGLRPSCRQVKLWDLC